jgi:hypothetical protein
MGSRTACRDDPEHYRRVATLAGCAVKCAEGGLVHPQQHPSFLIQRRLRPHPPAAAERDGEAPHPALLAAGFEVAEATPIHLRLFAGWCFKPANGGRHPGGSFRGSGHNDRRYEPLFCGRHKTEREYLEEPRKCCPRALFRWSACRVWQRMRGNYETQSADSQKRVVTNSAELSLTIEGALERRM